MIGIHPLRGIGEVQPGSDLAALLLEAITAGGLHVEPGDVIVVTQKILSKAQDRFVSLEGVEPGAEAQRLAEITRKDARFVEMVLRELNEVVRAAPHVLITRHLQGFVMANAGIDRSNLGPGREEQVLLLPDDPDGAAEQIRAEIAARTGVAPAVLISDSFGRPWRNGVVGVAIGAAGFAALADRRGEADRDGRTLEVTQVALGDLLAAAACLVTGEGAEGVPAALIRGVALDDAARPASALVRPVNEDLFR